MTAYHRLPASLLAEPDPFDDLEVDERAEPTGGPSRPRSVPTVGEVAGRIRPTVLAVDRTLPVLPALAGLFPGDSAGAPRSVSRVWGPVPWPWP